MITSTVEGARERRGARREPKRQRSCEGRHQPSKTHAAKPPQSGRPVRGRTRPEIDSTARKTALAGVECPVEILKVPPSSVRAIWPRCERHIEAALELDGGCFWLADLCDCCASGAMQLWIAVQGEELLAAVVSLISDYPRKRVFSVLYVGGVRLMDWLPEMLRVTEAWSRSVGCVAMAGALRRGWARAASMRETGAFLWRNYEDTHVPSGGRA